MIPELETDEQRLRYLLYIRQHVPALFEEAARYDIDLLDLLENEARLLKMLLARHPDYVRQLQSRTDYLDITVIAQGEQTVVERRVSPEAVADWRRQLSVTLDELTEDSGGGSAEELIFRKVRDLLAQKGRQSFSGFLAAISREFPDNLKQQLFHGGDPRVIADLAVKQVLEQGLPQNFKPEKLGMPAGATDVQALIERFTELAEIEHRLRRHVSLYNIMAAADGSIQTDVESLRARISGLDANDLSMYGDPDAIKPRVATMSDRYRAAFGALNAKEVVRLARSFAAEFTSKTERVESAISGSLRLKEVTPDIGIYRGCAGGDCSTQYSFQFPNDPNERVFFVLDQESGKPVGYFTGTIVDSLGKPVFYVITASGERMTSAQTMMALHGLDAAQAELGVTGIVLPEHGRVDGLLNFEQQRGVFIGSSSSSESVPIRYRNPKLRRTLEEFEYKGAINSYDAVAENKSALPLRLSRESVRALRTEVRRFRYGPPELPVLTDRLVLEFALDLHFSGRTEQMREVMAIRGVSPDAVQKVLDTLANAKRLNVAEFEADVTRLLRETVLGEELITRKEYLLHQGRLRAPDAMAPANRAKTVKIIIHALREHEDLALEAEVVDKFAQSFRTERAFQRQVGAMLADRDELEFQKAMRLIGSAGGALDEANSAHLQQRIADLLLAAEPHQFEKGVKYARRYKVKLSQETIGALNERFAAIQNWAVTAEDIYELNLLYNYRLALEQQALLHELDGRVLKFTADERRQVEDRIIRSFSDAADSGNDRALRMWRERERQDPLASERIMSAYEAAIERSRARALAALRGNDTDAALDMVLKVFRHNYLISDDEINRAVVHVLRARTEDPAAIPDRIAPKGDPLDVAAYEFDLRDLPDYERLLPRMQAQRLRAARSAAEWIRIANSTWGGSSETEALTRRIIQDNIHTYPLASATPEENARMEKFLEEWKVTGTGGGETKYFKLGREDALYEQFFALYPEQAKNLDTQGRPKGVVWDAFIGDVLRDPDLPDALYYDAINYLVRTQQNKRLIDLMPYLGRRKLMDWLNEHATYEVLGKMRDGRPSLTLDNFELALDRLRDGPSADAITDGRHSIAAQAERRRGSMVQRLADTCAHQWARLRNLRLSR